MRIIADSVPYNGRLFPVEAVYSLKRPFVPCEGRLFPLLARV